MWDTESEFLIFPHCAGETYFSAKQSFVMKQSCSGPILCIGWSLPKYQFSQKKKKKIKMWKFDIWNIPK